MPIPVVSYSDPQLSQPIDPISPLMHGFQQGMSLGDQMQQMMQRAKAAPYQRALLEAQAKRTQAQVPLTQAQAHLYQTQAKFAPLKLALAAQQQSQMSQRFGPGYMWAKTIMSMPSDQREQWFANPVNSATFNAITKSFSSQALQTGASPISTLTNKLMKQAFPSMGSSPTPPPASIMQQGGMPSALQPPQNAFQPSPGIPSQGALGIQTMPTSLPPSQTQGMPQQPQAPGAIPPPPSMSPTRSLTSAANAQVQAAGFPALPTSTLNVATGLPGATSDPTLNAQQLIANKDAIKDKGINSRAAAAVQLGLWLQNNQPEYSKRINTALQYAGLTGMTERQREAWMNKNTSALSDYDWFSKTFGLFAGNGVRLMEKMGATDEQTKHLTQMINSIKDPSTNPERARQDINKMFGTFHEYENSILQAGEAPGYHGMYKRIYNLKDLIGNYLDSGKSSVPNAQTASAPQGGGMVRIKSSDGRVWNIPAANVSKALARGGVRA